MSTHHPDGAGTGPSPQPGQPHPGQPHSGQPHSGQPHSGQPSPGQPQPGQPQLSHPHAGHHPGHPHSPQPGAPGPEHPHPWELYPGQAYPGEPYPGQQHLGPIPRYPNQPPPSQPYGGPYATQPYPTQQWPGLPPGVAWPAQPRFAYAHWGRRVGAYAIDFSPGIVGVIFIYVWYFGLLLRMFDAIRSEDVDPLGLFSVSPTLVVGLVLVALAWVFDIWNRYFHGGRTGQTLGKRALRIRLVSEQTGEPIGALNAFLRDLLHYLDGAAYVGYLWPLWDDKRQTFADKLMHTVVIDADVSRDRAPGSRADPLIERR